MCTDTKAASPTLSPVRLGTKYKSYILNALSQGYHPPFDPTNTEYPLVPKNKDHHNNIATPNIPATAIPNRLLAAHSKLLPASEGYVPYCVPLLWL